MPCGSFIVCFSWGAGYCLCAAAVHRQSGKTLVQLLLVRPAAAASARAVMPQQRPIFQAAGVLVVVSVLLFLVGFLSELIVTQGERITQLERQFSRRERQKP